MKQRSLVLFLGNGQTPIGKDSTLTPRSINNWISVLITEQDRKFSSRVVNSIMEEKLPALVILRAPEERVDPYSAQGNFHERVLHFFDRFIEKVQKK